MFAMNGLPCESIMLPENKDARPGLPSLKMITPEAWALWALRTLTPKLHVPRWIRAIRPGVNPLKSAIEHPLAELGAGDGGRTMPPTGWTTADAVPALAPEFQSVPAA